MTWTILVLVLGAALFLFGGMLFGQKGAKKSTGAYLMKKSLKLVAIILVAGGVCRLWTPYYLTSVNPMILQDMANGMQEQKQAEASKNVREYVSKNMEKMTEGATILGNPDAKNTIFVFSATSCGYCKRVHSELERVLADRDDVRVVVKHFSIHGVVSDIPARAVLAANAQGADKAAKLYNAIMTGEYYTQDDMKDQATAPAKITKNIMKMAKDAGLDTKKLESDMNSPAVSREFSQVRELASRFEIGGTPYLIINDQAFPGAIPYEQIIEALN